MRGQYPVHLACILGFFVAVGSGCATGGDDDTGLFDPPATMDAGKDSSTAHPHDSGTSPPPPPPYDSGNGADQYVPPPVDSGGPPPDDSGGPPPFDAGNPPPPMDAGTGFCDTSTTANAAKYFLEWTAASSPPPCTDNSQCSSGQCCYKLGMACVAQ